MFFLVLFNVYIFLLQLQEANQKVSEALIKLKDVESELLVTKERCDEQTNDLLQKSGILLVI